MYRNDVSNVTEAMKARFRDAWQDPQAVLDALAACSEKADVQRLQAPGGNNRGNSWTKGNTGITRFNTIVPPNSREYWWGSCSFHVGLWAGNSQFTNATSEHNGGANFLFADGSTHFLKGSIDIRTYWSLGTRADGEIISADSY